MEFKVSKYLWSVPHIAFETFWADVEFKTENEKKLWLLGIDKQDHQISVDNKIFIFGFC